VQEYIIEGKTLIRHNRDRHNVPTKRNFVDDNNPRKVKTTIDLPEDLWKKFSIKVIEKYGGRKKNDVIEELIRKYLDEDDDDA
jgi:hypothetical protein